MKRTNPHLRRDVFLLIMRRPLSPQFTSQAHGVISSCGRFSNYSRTYTLFQLEQFAFKDPKSQVSFPILLQTL